MLEKLRDASKTWVAAIFIGALIISFAIWGINDIFSGRRSTAIAKVNGVELDVRTFEQEFNQRLRRMTKPDGRPMTAAEARAQNLDRLVLNDIISNMAVLDAASRAGFVATDEMVRKEIANISGMTGPDGKIDQVRLAEGLSRAGLTETEFVQQMRDEIMTQTLLRNAAIGAPAPRVMALGLQGYENERRSFEYIVLPAEKAGTIAAPDDATLKAYMEANKARYTAPELRKITLASVSPDDLMADIQVSEDEIKAEYETSRAKFEIKETREFQQIVYPSREEADAAKKLLDEGKTFDDLVTAKNLKPEDIDLGTVTKGETSVPAEAFEAAEGAIAGPLQGPFGWVLIKVLKIHPGSIKTLEEVRTELRDTVARAHAVEKISGLINEIEDAIAGSDDLKGAVESLSGKIKMNLQTIEALDASGNDAAGKPVTAIPDGPRFLSEVFDTDQGDKSPLGETPKHVLYVFNVDQVTPPALRDVNAVREDVSKAWTAEQQAKALDVLAAEKVKAANAAGMDAATAAKDLGLTAATSEPIGRTTPSETFTPALVEAVFQAKAGEWVSAPGLPPEVMLARVKDISADKPADMAEQERTFRSAETRATSGEMVEIYRDMIVKAAKVEVDETLFNQLRTRGQ